MRKPQTEKGIENQQLGELTPSAERTGRTGLQTTQTIDILQGGADEPAPCVGTRQCNIRRPPLRPSTLQPDCEADNFDSPREEAPTAQDRECLPTGQVTYSEEKLELLEEYLCDRHGHGGCHLL